MNESGFETKEQAVRTRDEPLRGFGKEKYLFSGSSVGVATPAKETTINGFPAIVADDIPVRLYGTNGYAGTGEGRAIFIVGSNVYASIRIEADYDETTNQMLSTFRFVTI